MVPAVDGQPQERDEGQRGRQADQRGTEKAGSRIRDRIAGGDDEADQEPCDGRGREEAEVGRPVARVHDQRVYGVRSLGRCPRPDPAREAVHRSTDSPAWRRSDRRAANDGPGSDVRRVGRMPYRVSARRWTGRCRGMGNNRRRRDPVAACSPGRGCRRPPSRSVPEPLPAASDRRRPCRPAPSRGSEGRPRRGDGRSSPRSPWRRSAAGASHGRAGVRGPDRERRTTCSP